MKIKKHNFRVAIVHDALLQDGGSERVLEALALAFPDADIFTSLVSSDNFFYQKNKKRLKKYFLLLNSYNWGEHWLKPIILIYWKLLNLNEYDLIISSSHSYSSKSVNCPAGSKHICYCHTPPKYLYGGATEHSVGGLLSIFLKPIYFFIRSQDYLAAQKVDLFITNSTHIKKKVEQFYHKQASVVYPPIEVPLHLPPKVMSSRYYVYVGRLVKGKGLDLIIQACNHLHRQLYIIGEGPELKHLKEIALQNVHFLGYLADEETVKWVKNAKALLFAAFEEDFGIVPIEAMGQGLPVIAYYSGGVAETLQDRKTGLFFYKYQVKAVERAILKFESMQFSRKYIHNWAKTFSKDRFIKTMKEIVSSVLESK